LPCSGNRPLPSLVFPSYGSVVAKEKGVRNGMPPYVTIPQSFPAGGPGFLGGEYGPFIAGDPNAAGYKVRDLGVPLDTDWTRLGHRQALLNSSIRVPRGRAEAGSRPDKFYERPTAFASARREGLRGA
jgi:hypothetical protein